MSRNDKLPEALFWILSKFIPDQVGPIGLGDFKEEYHRLNEGQNRSRANIWLARMIIKSMPHFLMDLLRVETTMFRSYLIAARRMIKTSPVYSLINILGLSVGLAACALAFLYVRDELSFDRYNKKYDRICRIIVEQVRDGREGRSIGIGSAVATALVQAFPEVEDAVRFFDSGPVKVKAGKNLFRENRAYYADPSFFNVFSIPLVKGHLGTALVAPRSLVLSQTACLKYFGQEDPIGKTIRLNDKDDYVISGVFANIPRLSHFHFDFLISLSTIELTKPPSDSLAWGGFDFRTYLLLRKGTSLRVLEAKLPSLINPHLRAEFESALGMSMDRYMAKTGWKIDYSLQSLRDIHLRSGALSGEFEPTSDIKYVALFIAISSLILILAIINFINLSTSRASSRANEVSLRKVLGSLRRNILGQFLLESVSLSFLSLGFAVLMIGFILHPFNQLTGKAFSMRDLGDPLTAGILIASMIIVGLLAGIYPSLVIASIRPVMVLRGSLSRGKEGGRFRRALVVFQFTISIFALAGTGVVVRQIDYIRTKNLGFNKEQLLIIRCGGLLGNQAETLKQEVLKNPSIIKATLSSHLPIPLSLKGMMPVAKEGDPRPVEAERINFWTVDSDFIDTFQIKILEGRNFSRWHITDLGAFLINQSAAKHLGLDKPFEQRLSRIETGPQGIYPTYHSIIGIVGDFHFESLRNYIAPLVIQLGGSTGNLILRIKWGNIPETIGMLEKEWRTLFPEEPFEYTFLDEGFKSLYASELRTKRIFSFFAGLTVFIGCLGILGLASFSIAKKRREIAIRKVSGATVGGIIHILIKEYVFLICLANLIAWPLTYLFMRTWLLQFAYRIEIGVAVHLWSGILALVLAILTVLHQAVSAARTNPADILRHE
jgi:putative ABC transport system permease protein